jgi:hypothetical protein
VKLFQIEEPEGGPADPSVPGAAIGIDACGAELKLAFAVGGNAEMLIDRGGSARSLSVPSATATPDRWRELLEAAKARAERALARPVTHAVIVVADALDAGSSERLRSAAADAGLEVLRHVTTAELPAGLIPVLAAATLAEDLAPRPE